MKKLYAVMVEYEVVVLAEDEIDAQDFATEAASDCAPSIHATELRTLPSGWDGDELPFGAQEEEDGERTIAELVRDGCAPKLRDETRTRILSLLSSPSESPATTGGDPRG